MHQRLHPHWAERALSAFDQRPATDPLNDPSLEVTVALSIDVNGGIAAVDVVRTSGVAAFDRAAVDAFIAAAAFAPPPAPIRSGDGNVHLRWTLYRDQRTCSTFGADPQIDP